MGQDYLNDVLESTREVFISTLCLHLIRLHICIFSSFALMSNFTIINIVHAEDI